MSNYAATPELLLKQARELYEQRQYEESAQAFNLLAQNAEYAAEGSYGLGVIRLTHGDLDGAERLLLRSVELDRSHGNAYYQLGTIAERRGDTAQATRWYERAVTVQPQHAAAQQALSRLREPPAAKATQPSWTQTAQTQPGQPQPPPPTAPPIPIMVPPVSIPPGEPGVASPPPHGGVPAQYGVYEYLTQDSSPLARKTLESIDALRVRRMPYLSAHLGSVLKRIVILILIIIVLGAITNWVAQVSGSSSDIAHGAITNRVAQVSGSSVAQDVGGKLVTAAVLICIGELIVHLLRIVTTRYTLERGRLQIEKGIFSRRLTNLELWRVENIELHRTLLQRLTQDGKLVIEVINPAPVGKKTKKNRPTEVVGIARGARLQPFYHNLLNLIWLLRGNPAVKGIIY